MSAVEEHLPVLREFVEAVSERDPDMISACLHYTPPGTLAQIAAMWISELLAEADERELEIAVLRKRQLDPRLPAAYQRMRERALAAERSAAELRELLQIRAGAIATQKRKDAA